MIHPGIRIMIAGDSWGCGEWDNTIPYVRPHLGTEQYFREYGCNVMNISIGGADNALSAKSIMLLAPMFNPHLIFWIQSDPLRSIKLKAAFPETLDELLHYQRKHLSDIYMQLNSLGSTIHCIGGCSKLDSQLIANYPNLIPIIPSIIEFFGCVSPAIWSSAFLIDQIRPDVPVTVLDMLLENTADPLKIFDQKWFFPDGAHPNRSAHLKIFEYLVQHVDSPKI